MPLGWLPRGGKIKWNGGGEKKENEIITTIIKQESGPARATDDDVAKSKGWINPTF